MLQLGSQTALSTSPGRRPPNGGSMHQEWRKSITTLVFVLASALSASVLAQAPRTPLALKPDAPERYVVAPGDTLWSIAQRYTDSPWRWNELWNLNKDQIKNPHRIYPGNVIVLDRSKGQLAVSDTVRLSPKVRAESTARTAIPSIPPALIEPFLARPLVVEPDGLVALQAITVADQRYEAARRAPDFIKQYVFPGSCIPSVGVLLDASSRASDLRVVDIEDFTPHYARTMAEWRANLEAHDDRVRPMTTERFRRLWMLYLAYCEGGFRERHTGLVQLVLARPAWRGQIDRGAVPEFQAVGHDITVRKKAESAMQAAKEDAESADRAGGNHAQ